MPPDIQELEGLLRDLLNGIQETLQMGEILSDEFQGQLANTISLITQRIDELKSQTATQPELPASEIESSNVHGFMYNPKTQQLLVQFHGPYPKSAGSIYSYSGVPQFIFNILEKGAIGPKSSGKNRYHQWIRGVTPSLGGTLNALIKAGGFQYQKLT